MHNDISVVKDLGGGAGAWSKIITKCLNFTRIFKINDVNF